MVAKLHRFYGRAPVESGNWLDVPEWLFTTYDRAQPRLEAEEQQLLLRTLVAGTGHMEEKEFANLQRALEAQATGAPPRSGAIKPKSAAEMRALIAGLDVRGFKVDIKD